MKLHLIEIGADGAPARCPGQTPPLARDAIEGTVNLYDAVGFERPWVGYLADWDGELVGACTFKAPPRDGVVEIALQTFAGFEGRGVAQEMTRQLVQRAWDVDPGLSLVAHTLPRRNPAGSILSKLGFARLGEVRLPDQSAVWQWRLRPGAEQVGARA